MCPWRCALTEKKKMVVERAKVLQNLAPLVPQDGPGLKRYPVLLDLLTPRWSDGQQTRMAGRLAIRVEGSYFRVTVECPTEGLMTSVVTDSLVDMLDALEANVASGKAAWQQTYDAARKSRKSLMDELQ